MCALENEDRELEEARSKLEKQDLSIWALNKDFDSVMGGAW